MSYGVHVYSVYSVYSVDTWALTSLIGSGDSKLAKAIARSARDSNSELNDAFSFVE